MRLRQKSLFLMYSVIILIVGGSLYWAFLGGKITTTAETLSEQPLFSFAAITDLHIGLDQDNLEWSMAGSKASEILANAVSDINSHSPQVAFTVVLGDISSNGTREQLNTAKSILDGLQTPYQVVPGNHDSMADGNLNNFKNTFGLTDTNYSFDSNNFHFVVLDSIWQANIDFLNIDLSNNTGKSTFVFNHWPIWDYDDANNPWAPNDPFFSNDQTQPLRSALENSNQVVAYLNGHAHLNRYTYNNGVGYATIGSLIVYPAEIRYFDVYIDRTVSYPVTISNQNLRDYVYSLASDERKAKIDGEPNNKNFTIILPPKPVITLFKSVDKNSAWPGEILTYSINYANTSNREAQNIQIEDYLPYGTSYLGSDGFFDGTKIIWNLWNLAAGASGSVQFQVRVE